MLAGEDSLDRAASYLVPARERSLGLRRGANLMNVIPGQPRLQAAVFRAREKFQVVKAKTRALAASVMNVMHGRDFSVRLFVDDDLDAASPICELRGRVAVTIQRALPDPAGGIEPPVFDAVVRFSQAASGWGASVAERVAPRLASEDGRLFAASAGACRHVLSLTGEGGR